MSSARYNIDDLVLIGYAEVVPKQFLPRIVPPIYSNGETALLPPYTEDSGFLVGAMTASDQELSELARRGEITLFPEQLKAVKEFILWLDDNHAVHYERQDTAESALREYSVEKVRGAHKALDARDLEGALKLSQLAINSNESSINAILIKAIVHKLMGEEDLVETLSSIAFAVDPNVDFESFLALTTAGWERTPETEEIPPESRKSSHWPEYCERVNKERALEATITGYYHSGSRPPKVYTRFLSAIARLIARTLDIKYKDIPVKTRKAEDYQFLVQGLLSGSAVTPELAFATSNRLEKSDFLELGYINHCAVYVPEEQVEEFVAEATWLNDALDENQPIPEQLSGNEGNISRLLNLCVEQDYAIVLQSSSVVAEEVEEWDRSRFLKAQHPNQLKKLDRAPSLEPLDMQASLEKRMSIGTSAIALLDLRTALALLHQFSGKGRVYAICFNETLPAGMFYPSGDETFAEMLRVAIDSSFRRNGQWDEEFSYLTSQAGVLLYPMPQWSKKDVSYMVDARAKKRAQK